MIRHTWEWGNVEGQHGLGDVLALADDLVILSPLVHLLVAHARHGRVFLGMRGAERSYVVEILFKLYEGVHVPLDIL